MKKVFISGRITGDRHYKSKFDAVADKLKAQGVAVLNPATLPLGLTYADYARICHAMIEAADVILMLPGYADSRGAMLEMNYAKYIGKEVEYYGDTEATVCKRPTWGKDECYW